MPRTKVSARPRDASAPADPESSNREESFLDNHGLDISWPIRESEVAKYLEVNRRHINRTRFIKRETLEVQCRMWEPFKQLLDASGLAFFFGCQDLVYKDLVQEFYTTAFTNERVNISIHCRLKGNELEITPRLLRKIFKFARSKETFFGPGEVCSDVWEALGGGESYHTSGGNKVTYIKETIHGIFHKFLAHAFFGKCESNKINSIELYILWRAIQHKKFDASTVLFNKLVDCSRGVGGRNLILGHVITRIAAYKGFIEPGDLDRWQDMPGKEIDVKTLQHAYLISMSDPTKRVPWEQRPAWRAIIRGRNPDGPSSGLNWEPLAATDEDEPDMGGQNPDTHMPDVHGHDQAGPSSFSTDSMGMIREQFDCMNARFDSLDTRMGQIEHNQNEFYAQICSQMEQMGARMQELARNQPNYTQSTGYSPSQAHQPPAP